MGPGNPFRNAQSQANASGLLGTGFIDPVESPENLFLLVFGDADPRILHLNERGVPLFF